MTTFCPHDVIDYRDEQGHWIPAEVIEVLPALLWVHSAGCCVDVPVAPERARLHETAVAS